MSVSMTLTVLHRPHALMLTCSACADVPCCCRGNLGLDCLPEKMALVQKNLIQSCNLVGVWLIVASSRMHVPAMLLGACRIIDVAHGNRQTCWISRTVP
jgi:hypothetical protein